MPSPRRVPPPESDHADAAVSDVPLSEDVGEDNALDPGDARTDAPRPAIDTVPGVALRIEPRDGVDFYGTPWPSAHRRTADGGVRMGDFPNPNAIGLVQAAIDLVERDADGFGTTSGIFLAFDGPLSAEDLSATESLTDASTVWLLQLDGPGAGRRRPVHVRWLEDGGPHGTTNLLAALPLQGAPLTPNALHALVVRRSFAPELGRSDAVARLLNGALDDLEPATASVYRDAVNALEALGVALDDIAGFTAFRTGNPTAALHALFDHSQAGAAPADRLFDDRTWTHTETHERFCVFDTTIALPVWQQGTPPFSTQGGDWPPDAAASAPLSTETARVFVTLPREPAPATGWPVVVMSRTGGGGDRPLIDRGLRAEPGGSTVPGSGPASHFAAVGWAGLTVDGPHGGVRNVTRGDEQFLMFNVTNVRALRDNVRQSALELALVLAALPTLSFDASGCAGTSAVAVFDPADRVLFGHSMGATIAPLTAAIDGALSGLLLSGAGAGWIGNILDKQSPVPTRPLAETLLRYPPGALHAHDPVISLVQWAGEPADPAVYGAELAEAGTHVFMMQGIVDTYILPSIANPAALAFGLDLAGAALDAETAELDAFAPLASELPLAGGTTIGLPAAANRQTAEGASRTAVVVQYPEGPVEDGHEVAFQTEAPQAAYRCWLATLREGTPTVVGDGDACP